MIPFLLNLTNKNITVIGGGKMAHRKIKQFIKEKAIVKVVAPSVIDEIKDTPCQIVFKEYDTLDLKNTFLVCAATNDVALNQKIVKEAKELGILTLSVTNTESDLHSMKIIQTDELTMGISTQHTYPAFLNKIEEDLKRYEIPLQLLSEIRKYILENELVFENKRSYFFNQLMIFNDEDLFVLLECIKNSPSILVFTGELEDSSLNFARELKALALSYRDELFNIKMELLSLININWLVQPMVVAEGKIYERIKEHSYDMFILPPLFMDDALLKQRYQIYQSDRLFIIHPRGSENLAKMLNQYGQVITFEQSLPKDEVNEIIPFILSSGYHYKKDIETLGVNSSMLFPVLLKEEKMLNLLKSLLKHRFHNI